MAFCEIIVEATFSLNESKSSSSSDRLMYCSSAAAVSLAVGGGRVRLGAILSGELGTEEPAVEAPSVLALVDIVCR